MNKHYDKYLCRATPRELSKVYEDHLGREYVYIGSDKYFLSKPYTSGDVEICYLSPTGQFEQVDPNITLASKFVLKICLALFVLVGICTYFSIK